MRSSDAVLCIALVAALSGVASAGKIEVPKDFATIQEAVDAAGSGDTIVVRAGPYVESVTIADKTRLSLRGIGHPIVDGGGAAHVLSISGSDGVKVSGFEMHSAIDGVVVTDSTKVLLRGCTIRDVTSDGVVVGASTSVKLDRSRIQDVGDDAVEILEDASLCTLSKNDVSTCADSGLIVLGNLNKITKNDVDGCGDDGVRIWGDDNTAIGNRITDCDDDGFDLYRASGNTLRKNTVTDAGQHGFQIDQGSGNEAVKNVVKKSGRAGFLMESPDGKLQKNKVFDSVRYGIQMSIGGNDVIGNVLKRNAEFDLFEDQGLVTPNRYKKNKLTTTNIDFDT